MLKVTKLKKDFILPSLLVLCISITGCIATTPKKLFTLSEDSLQVRQLQMRQFETINEAEVLSACAGALQDMGFTLDDSETELGLVVASKSRDATDAVQVAAATAAVALAALSGTNTNAFDYIDKEQKIRVSVVSKLNAEGNKLIVRTTFQRIVWNRLGNVSRLETLKGPELYQGFFDKVSKAIFLEGQEI
ncbi:MAG: hypothetical protein HQ549_00325 [Candidatus Omnitrophica bacterium]|nr:hypothetical protein [Candidatus Omnitrophota bacterium]